MLLIPLICAMMALFLYLLLLFEDINIIGHWFCLKSDFFYYCNEQAFKARGSDRFLKASMIDFELV